MPIGVYDSRGYDLKLEIQSLSETDRHTQHSRCGSMGAVAGTGVSLTLALLMFCTRISTVRGKVAEAAERSASRDADGMLVQLKANVASPAPGCRGSSGEHVSSCLVRDAQIDFGHGDTEASYQRSESTDSGPQMSFPPEVIQ